MGALKLVGQIFFAVLNWKEIIGIIKSLIEIVKSWKKDCGNKPNDN